MKDRRVRRTEQVLKAALHSLIGEKPYHSIAVKEILDRADVGRSTFYTHFRDKDDLLVEGIYDIVNGARAMPVSTKKSEHLLRFSLPILEHHERHRRLGEQITPAAQTTIHARLQEAIAHLIRDDLRSEKNASPELIAQFVASTFILVLHWWVVTDRSAKEADALFRAFTLPALAAMVD